MKLYYYFIISLFFFSIVTAFDEQTQAICGGDSELKILCNGQVEQLYEIPEFVDVSILFPDGTDISSPTFTLIVNASNILLCNYSIDNVANISIGAVNHYFTNPVSVVDGNHIIDIWCRDTFNLNNSYHDSIGFYVYTITSPGGGGDSTIPIKLYRMLIFGNAWILNESNIVNVHIFDISGNFIDPNFVNMTIISKVNLNSQNILRTSRGKYRGVFNISDSDTSEVIINITAVEDSKTISNLFTINIEAPSTIDEIKNYILYSTSRIGSFYKKYYLYIWIILVALLILLLYLLYYLLSNRINKMQK